MKKIITSLVFAAILFIGLKLVLPNRPNDEASIKHFWMSKTFAGDNYDIVISGDSRVYRGISPDDLLKGADNSSLNAINIGFSSTGFSPEYFNFAISKFDKTAKHKILVLGVTPHSLTAEAFKNEHLHSFQNYTAKEQFKLIHLYRLLRPFSPYKLSDLSQVNENNYQQEYFDNGWVASNYLTPDTSIAISSYTKIFNKYQVKPEQVQVFIDEIQKLIEQQYIIVAFRPPSSQTMRNLEDSVSNVNMNEIAMKLKKHGAYWIEINEGKYQSYDGSHLNEESARKLSFELGVEIRKILENN